MKLPPMLILIDNFKINFLGQHCHGAREVTASDSSVYIRTLFMVLVGQIPFTSTEILVEPKGEEAMRNVAAKEDYVIPPFPNKK
jgi:hypothetical protein